MTQDKIYFIILTDYHIVGVKQFVWVFVADVITGIKWFLRGREYVTNM